MNIKVLGTRGEIKVSAPHYRKKSGVLINDILLLDCGDSSFLRYQQSAILITHLHPDHAFFVRKGTTSPITLPCPCWAPEPFGAVNLTVPQKPFTLNGYRITPIPTIHSIKVKSQAYIIEQHKKRILYTGDMIWVEKQYHHLLHDLDLVITEASHMKEGGFVHRNKLTGHIFGHTGIPNLIHLFKPYTKHMLFVHYGSWFFKNIQESKNKFNRLAEQNDMELIISHDGFAMSI